MFTEPDTPVLKMLPEQTTTNSCSFRWDPPLNPRGEIKNYNIFIKFIDFSYFNPSYCFNDFAKEFEDSVMVDARNEFTFRQAFPFASYSIQIQAKNGEDVSDYTTTPQTCETFSGLKFQRKCSVMSNYKYLNLRYSRQSKKLENHQRRAKAK